MRRKRSLSEAMRAFAGKQQNVTQDASRHIGRVAETLERPSAATPARAGKRLVGGHFDKAVSQQLRELAAREDTTVQALLANAINMLFVTRGLPEIAEPRTARANKGQLTGKRGERLTSRLFITRT